MLAKKGHTTFRGILGFLGYLLIAIGAVTAGAFKQVALGTIIMGAGSILVGLSMLITKK